MPPIFNIVPNTWKYLRYFALTALGAIAIASTMMGGWYLWLGFALAVVFAVGGDLLLGDDLEEPGYRHTWLLNVQLYLNLPLLIAMSFAVAWQLSPRDVLGVGAALGEVFQYDFLAAKAATQWYHLLGAALGLGLYYGGAGTNVGHELTHRTWSASAQIVGRWLLAFTGDASFAIEHVYGHHKHVATERDPATARRGESSWAFVPRSTVFSYLSAWGIERERLKRQGRGVWTWHNRMIRGNLMTATIAAGFFLVAGLPGLLAYLAIMAYGKCYLEVINYTEHYGLVRVPGKPVEPRHSWNCNRRISGYLLYNLTRHSHHHAMGEKPFWELRAYPNTPMMPFGYLTMIIVALIPPLWNRVMIPRVLAWDEEFASDEERPLIEAANQRSGHAWFTDGLPAHIALPKITTDAGSMFDLEAANDQVEHDRPHEHDAPLAEVIRGMFGGSARHTATIAQREEPLAIEPRQTILQAALEQGVAFPHNCRVGGCASCKCKLVEGEVREMTDSSYILTAEELQEGYILACQSIPKTDVVLDVPNLGDSAAQHPNITTRGLIVALRPLNHDIMHLVLELDTPITYTPGQYADLSAPGHIDAPRSFSFADPCDGPTTRVSFHIRRVPGGAFTGWLHDEAEVGQDLLLTGPFGDFWLRPSEAPILAIAGGTGLAPIEALLQHARANRITRDVILLHGVRTREDQYHADEMKRLARGWLANMTYVPVLSDEPTDSDWDGARGLVTEKLAHITNLGRYDAYLCGPPAMIDAATETLTRAGITRDRIHSDAFLFTSGAARVAAAGE